MATATYTFAQNIAGIWPLPQRRRHDSGEVLRLMEIPHRYFSPGPRGRIERRVLVAVAIEQAKGCRQLLVDDILSRERLNRIELRDAVASLLDRNLLRIQAGSITPRLPARMGR